MINPSYVVNPTLYGKVPYEFGKDFDPVSLAALTTLVITVHPSVSAHTLQDLVALIKANPGKYSYASPGTGTPGHLVGETFRLSLGLDLVHVPFNSAGLAVGSAVGGHTQICFASPSPAAQQVIEGRLRGLAVTSKTRSQARDVLHRAVEKQRLRDPQQRQPQSFDRLNVARFTVCYAERRRAGNRARKPNPINQLHSLSPPILFFTRQPRTHCGWNCTNKRSHEGWKELPEPIPQEKSD